MIRLQKGFEGEQLYDKILDETGHSAIGIFRDIWIKVGKSLTQIDSLIISDDMVIINEIKNYSGQYAYENNIWQVGKIQISDDPIIQTKRTSSKLIKIFRENNLQVNVDSKVIFPNPYFIISTDDTTCLSSIIKRDRLKIYMRTFNQLPSWKKSENIVELIEAYRIPEPAYEQDTDFSRLRLGRYCTHCQSYDYDGHRGFTICKNCHERTDNKDHILTAARDFKVLAHDQRITTAAIHKILNAEISYSTVQRKLRKDCRPVNRGRVRTYELL